jgi:flagellar biosynthetic protein FliO
MCTRLLSIAVILTFLAQPSLAATGVDSLANLSILPVSDVELPDTTGLVTRMLLSLTAVIVLIWGATRLLRKLSGDGNTGSGKSYIKILDRTYLAPKKAIYVINIGDRSLALGVTDSQISTLAELDNAETMAAFPSNKEGGAIPPFANLLKEVKSRFSSKGAKGETA